MSEFFRPDNPFLSYAFVCSILLGFYGLHIMEGGTKEKGGIFQEGKTLDWRLFHFAFHFAGSLAGWMALYFLWTTDLKTWEPAHFIALLIAFLGITGNLPRAVWLGRLPGMGGRDGK